jgi:hypothetical protein
MRSTARMISIKNLYRDNKKHQTIQVKVDSKNTLQGGMTITDYCAKFRTLADALVDAD